MRKALVVREAILEDRRVIWEWWNDPVTRKMMKKNDHVPWDEHCAWFEKILQDGDRILCVALVDGHKIGNVRFDLKADGVYEVSINLNPLFRGKGYSADVLAESIEYLRRIRDVKKLFAKTKRINLPSQKAFEKAGFVLMEDPKCDHPGMEDFVSESEVYCELRF